MYSVPGLYFIFHNIIFTRQVWEAMATSGPPGISTRSLNGALARAQHGRYHFTVIEPNFDKSDGESDSNEDKLTHIDEDESSYSSRSGREESVDADIDCGNRYR